MFRKLIALAFCCAAASAGAADNGFYFGAGASQSKFKVSGALDNQDNGYKAIVGFRVLDSFAVEANYHDHGKSSLPSGIACIALVGANCPATTNVAGKTAAAFAVGFVDFPLLDLFAKLGVASVKTEGRTPGVPSFNFNDTSTELAWGAGVQAHFGSLGARAEFEQFKLRSGVKLDSVSLSLLYTFL
jgi:hypothetical protein